MAKISMNSILHLNRRFQSVSAATENIRVPSATMRKESDSGTLKPESPAESKQSTFWMRDPNSGYWVPENHFNDVDVAELRDKLLAKK